MRISLEEASRLILSGQAAAVPTETVYGLAAALFIPEAVDSIYALKGRPSNNPLIVHVSDPSQVLSYSRGPIPDFQPLADAFWPGPMTLVIPIDENRIPSKARAGLPTAAFRIPSHPLVRALIAQTGPLVMPSANLSGRPSSTRADHIETDFGAHFPVLDGGSCDRGFESTILAYADGRWIIVREGALSAEAFAPILGYVPDISGQVADKPLCPGQLFRHYSPKARLHLIEEIAPGLSGAVLGFSDRAYPASCRLISLGRLADPEKIAENLYAVLRQIDREGIESVWVDMDFIPHGILSTVAERLRRASSKTCD